MLLRDSVYALIVVVMMIVTFCSAHADFAADWSLTYTLSHWQKLMTHISMHFVPVYNMHPSAPAVSEPSFKVRLFSAVFKSLLPEYSHSEWLCCFPPQILFTVLLWTAKHNYMVYTLQVILNFYYIFTLLLIILFE